MFTASCLTFPTKMHVVVFCFFVFLPLRMDHAMEMLTLIYSITPFIQLFLLPGLIYRALIRAVGCAGLCLIYTGVGFVWMACIMWHHLRFYAVIFIIVLRKEEGWNQQEWHTRLSTLTELINPTERGGEPLFTLLKMMILYVQPVPPDMFWLYLLDFSCCFFFLVI